MSARDVKAALIEQIETLTDEQALQVYEYVQTQYGEEDSPTPELLEELRKDLEQAQQTNYAGITTPELQQKMKQWLTR
jgi:hypothetical protein